MPTPASISATISIIPILVFLHFLFTIKLNTISKKIKFIINPANIPRIAPQNINPVFANIKLNMNKTINPIKVNTPKNPKNATKIFIQISIILNIPVKKFDCESSGSLITIFSCFFSTTIFSCSDFFSISSVFLSSLTNS